MSWQQLGNGQLAENAWATSGKESFEGVLVNFHGSTQLTSDFRLGNWQLAGLAATWHRQLTEATLAAPGKKS